MRKKIKHIESYAARQVGMVVTICRVTVPEKDTKGDADDRDATCPRCLKNF